MRNRKREKVFFAFYVNAKISRQTSRRKIKKGKRGWRAEGGGGRGGGENDEAGINYFCKKKKKHGNSWTQLPQLTFINLVISFFLLLFKPVDQNSRHVTF